MTNVVQLRRPIAEIEPSTFATAWSALPDTMRQRSEKKATVETLWDREAKRLNGQEDLLCRLRTYLRDCKDIARTGGPGLQVLLRAGRLEHWAPMQQTPLFAVKFENAAARDQVAAYKGEAFCRSYLDPCRVEGTTLLVRTDIAIKHLREVGAILKTHGFTGMKKMVEKTPKPELSENIRVDRGGESR
jgi:hypothetical protein